MEARAARFAGAWLLLVASACVASDPARAPRPSASGATLAESIETQARSAASGSRPRREHLAIAPLAGRWDTRVVAVGADGTESDPHDGRAEIEPVFGGRYLRWEATLELGDATHATTGFLGYDVNQAEYQMLMISDLATGMGVAHGRGDPHGQGIRFTIEIPDPATGALRRAVSLLRSLDADHFELEQFGSDAAGTERVVRRTHYRRVTGPRDPTRP